MASINITQEELSNFHTSHFSLQSTTHFSANFLGPVQEEEYIGEIEEDDGLGYYPDGVKCTLTDEQIAMFRHSEIQTLLRERRHKEENKDFDSPGDKSTSNEEGLEDGELDEETSSTSKKYVTLAPAPAVDTQHMSKKAKKIQYAKEKGFFKQKIKPDLRKRTWDKVDSGLDGLDYDEDSGGSGKAPTMKNQRRKISYDDD